jgi:hypothetical protein
MQTVDPDRLGGVDLRIAVPRDQLPDAVLRLGLNQLPARRRTIHLLDETPRAANGSSALLAPLARQGVTITLRTGGPSPEVTVRLQPVHTARLSADWWNQPMDDEETLHLRQDWNGSRTTLFAALSAKVPPAQALSGRGSSIPPRPPSARPPFTRPDAELLTAHQRSLLREIAGAGLPPEPTWLGPLDEQLWPLRAGGAELTVRRWSTPGVPVAEPGPGRFDELELVRPAALADAGFVRPVLVSLVRRLGLDPDSPAAPLPERAAHRLSAEAAARDRRQDRGSS